MPRRPDASDIPIDSRIAVDASEHERQELLELLTESASRRIESLKLYEPLPFQEAYHSCRAKTCIMQKGNQVGGSLSGFVEVARAVTGQDPYDKYPKRDGTVAILVYGEKHIGRVVHQYLFRAGAFYIIRDEETHEWRVYRPWPKERVFSGRPGDKHRSAEKKPAPPLIPQRYIKELAWEKKSEKIFSRVEFTTGWVLYAHNSAGDPSQAQGYQANLYHIDEDVATGGWLDEAIGRTMTREGLIRWTALPHAKTDDIVNVIAAAESDAGSENPTTVCVRATIFDNPFVSDESRADTIKQWKSKGEDVYRQRALGELTIDSVRMYPTFSKDLHNALVPVSEEDRKAEQEGVLVRTKVQQILTDNQGVPPEDWCRYMIVDPGHQVAAVVFIAVPPPSLGDFVVQYDELYLLQCDAVKFGEAVEKKAKHFAFQEFIIDAHGGRLTDLGSGLKPREQYEKQLVKRGISSIARGPRFTSGSDEITGRENLLREWLMVRNDGTTKFLICSERCPNTCREMRNFKKKTVQHAGQTVTLDEGNRRANTHTCECLEYAAAHGCKYVKPKGSRKASSWVDRVIAGREERARRRAAKSMGSGTTYRNLGPQGVSQ